MKQLKRGHMIKCICVDRHKDSRDAVSATINKINGVELIKSCSTLNAAFRGWQTTPVHILFIRVYNSPIPAEKLSLLEKIKEHGTQVIMLSTRISILHNTIAFHAADFVLLPTTPSRLCKASAKAIKIIDPSLDEPKVKPRSVSKSKKSLTN